jgi:hypothetical protein
MKLKCKAISTILVIIGWFTLWLIYIIISVVLLLIFCSYSSFSYPYPTKWGWYKFLSCCDKDSEIIFTTGRLPDVNPP